MLALLAVGVVTGTILSFGLGLLWPSFMATFSEVFGLGFMLEGFSFFVEAIFIAIYVYGWDRLSARAHFLSGVPVVIAVSGPPLSGPGRVWVHLEPAGDRPESRLVVRLHGWPHP